MITREILLNLISDEKEKFSRYSQLCAQYQIQQQQYSSKFAYLKAKVAWEFSQEISAASQKAAADNLNI